MAKSKYWDPSWRKPTYRVGYRNPSPELIQELLAEAGGSGLPDGEVPDFTPCIGLDGFARIAIVGPDYDVIVAAMDREHVAPLQQKVGRLTWYFLCTRPRVRAVPDGVRIEAGELILPFEMTLDDGTVKAAEHRQPVPDGLAAVHTESAGRFVIYEEHDGTTFPHEAALLVQGFLPAIKTALGAKHFDLRVHYIGRARGRTQETCALDRLVNHEKYQQVTEEVLASEHRNRDVWLVLASGTTINLTILHDDANAEDSPAIQKQNERWPEWARDLLDENDRVDLVEALLINYFKPPLNVHHRQGKLQLKDKVMMKCRKARLTGVVLSYGTSSLGISLYTDTISRRLQHTMLMPLI